MKCFRLHAKALQQHRQRAHGIGLFLQLDDLETPEQMTKPVLGESEVIMRRVMDRKQKSCCQQQLTPGDEDTEHFVDGPLRFWKMLEDFGAEDDVEAGVANPEGLGIAQDLNTLAACDVERDPPWEVSGVWPILRTNVERAALARMCRDESIERDPGQLC